MQSQKELKKIVDALTKENGLSREIIIEALVEGLKIAAKKKFGSTAQIEVKIDEESGEIEIYRLREVVDKVVDPDKEISF